MDQRVLGELAEEAARLADAGNTAGLSRLVQVAAKRHSYAPWAMTAMIAREWDRLGIRRVPMDVLVNG